MELTVKNCYKIKDDFENVFLSKSGIHVTPKYDRLKMASRSVSSTRYEDVYIVEPQSYYYLEFNEDLAAFVDTETVQVMHIDDVLYETGFVMSLNAQKNRLYIYNATQNIIYIEKGLKIGEVK